MHCGLNRRYSPSRLTAAAAADNDDDEDDDDDENLVHATV